MQLHRGPPLTSPAPRDDTSEPLSHQNKDRQMCRWNNPWLANSLTSNPTLPMKETKLPWGGRCLAHSVQESLTERNNIINNQPDPENHLDHGAVYSAVYYIYFELHVKKWGRNISLTFLILSQKKEATIFHLSLVLTGRTAGCRSNKAVTYNAICTIHSPT